MIYSDFVESNLYQVQGSRFKRLTKIFDTCFIRAKSESVSVFDSPTLKIMFWRITMMVNMVMMITITMMMRLLIMRMMMIRRRMTVSHLEVWFCDRCWKISPGGELTGPSGQAGVAPLKKALFLFDHLSLLSLSYIVFFRWPALRCSLVSYLCINIFNIFAISSTIMNDYMIIMIDRSSS